MPRATMTSKGQITIPKSVRDALHLHPGDRLDFILDGEGKAVLRPATMDVRDLEGILHRPGTKPVSVERMRQIVARRGSGRR
jgi:antitoxin PrlF